MSPKHAKPEPPEPEEQPKPQVEPTPDPEPTPPQPEPTPPTQPEPTRPPEPDPEPTRPPEPEPTPPTQPEPAPPAPEPPAPQARLRPPTRPVAARRPRGPRVRSRWMWTLLGVLGVVLVVWTVLSAQSPEPTTPAQPTPAPTAFAEQQTLLIQVRNDADLGADNMVAAVGGSLPAAQLLVPSRLIVDVPGAGQQTLGQSARLLDRSASQDALSDLLALRIDGTLSLARLALAGMVDYVGGITVDVDRAIPVTDEVTGTETVAVPAGTQTLDGNQAATYALAWLPEEPEASRMARYSQVMTATISSLPDDALRIQEMLTSLGGSARTTTTTPAVAEFLLQMRTSILAGGQQVRVLPTNDIEAGEALAVVRVDLRAADAVMTSLMPQAVLSGVESSPRVLVQNGVGTPGLGAGARDRLVGAGMVYINGGNAEQFGLEQTLVIVADDTSASLALGEQVAEALGVPATAVQIAEDGQNVADVVVVLGADFVA